MITNRNRVKGIITMAAALAVIIVVSVGGIYGWAPPLTPEQKFLAKLTKECKNCDLRNANLAGWDLSGANLKEATLSGANLNRANLNHASMFGTNLSNADLSGANLSGADFTAAILYGATWTDGSRCWSWTPGRCN